MTEEEKTGMMRQMSRALPVMRKSLKLSQSALSDLTGVSRSVISNIERGRQEMSWNAFIALLLVFYYNDGSRNLFGAFGIDTGKLRSFLAVEGSAAADPGKGVDENAS